eukprot:NODE_500_length_7578_cov_0.067790.p2 type:complete len:640 gc:universal NODE_500_length_7578_cov_0.067790:7488-5569(-)
MEHLLQRRLSLVFIFGVPKPLVMTWLPHFEKFTKFAKEIGDFIISDKITLFDSIAALEMMDPKMDYYSALQTKKAPVPNEENAIALLLHFLCGQSLTTCYYPHSNLLKIAQALKSFGLYEEEEIISHDCAVICQYGSAYEHPVLDCITADIYSMINLETPRKFQYTINPTNISSSVHNFLWASRSVDLPKSTALLDLPVPSLNEMLATPPRPLHLIPEPLIAPIYKFIYAYYADVHEKLLSFNPLGFNVYFYNFVNTLGNSHFYELSLLHFKAFNIEITDNAGLQVPLDVLQSIRHHLLLKNQSVGNIPFQDFLLLQFKSITKTIAVHDKQEVEKLANGPVSWPPPHLHDLLNQLLPGFNALFADLLHANQHNPGRVRRLITTFIESIHKIPFNQYDVILSQLTRDADKTQYLGFGVQLMTCMGLLQWLLIGYSLDLFETFDLLALSIQIEYISKSFTKLLEKQDRLFQKQASLCISYNSANTLLKNSYSSNLNHFDVLFVRMFQHYFSGFARLMVMQKASLKIPFELDMYTDEFYSLRYQKQFRVLHLAQFPPHLNYSHYKRKASSWSELKPEEVEEFFRNCLSTVNDIKVSKDWDVYTSTVLQDILDCCKNSCKMNIKVIRKRDAKVVKGRYFPHYE